MPRPTTLSERRRLEAIEILKRDKTITQEQVARRLGVTQPAISKWWKAYRAGGTKALKATPHTGRPGKVELELLQRLVPRLVQGAVAHGFETDVWTTSRIAKLIKREFGVAYHPDHVGRLLHKLGLSWQKPMVRAKERNDAEIQRWIKDEWPRLKKGRPGSAQ